MRKSLSLLAVGLSLLAFNLPQPVFAKSSGGSFCSSFRGSRMVDGVHPWYEPHSESRCFSTLSACKAWLYAIQTKYPFDMDFKACHSR